jgi:hypothetical protein
MKHLRRFRMDGYLEGRSSTAAAAFKAMELTLRALRDYHAHEAFGLESIPRRGPGLVVFNHSFATYDSWFFGVMAREDVGRRVWAVGDRLLLKFPLVGSIFRECNFIDGSRSAAIDLLKQGELLGVVPGGMREALRSTKDKYKVDWQGRLGFVWASVLSGAPIILGACPRADDIYDVADLEWTRKAYKRFKIPLALVRGLGSTPIPRPIRLWHVYSEPMVPPMAPEEATHERIAEYHAVVTDRMNRLMRDALELPAPS